MKERSDQMDKKIIEKRKKDDFEELLRQKRVNETKRKEEVKEDLDKRKKRKDKETEKKKGKIQEIKNNPNNPPYNLPNVKNLPENVQSLHPDCVEFCIPGDGACCLNCLAAWIYLDATYGARLGRDLNTHLAQYREYYKNKLVFPLTITVSGGLLKTFDKGEEDDFFDYLRESPEASYMWRESADMIGLTNFTQMEVEVNVYNS